MGQPTGMDYESQVEEKAVVESQNSEAQADEKKAE